MSENNLEHLRHSLAHLLAAAVMDIWPDTKRTIGPAIDNGFYYDMDFGDKKINDENLTEIEKKMNHIIKQNLKFIRSEMGIDEALAKEKSAGQAYKEEMIADLNSAQKDRYP